MKIFLKPGELCVCNRPAQVSTILGSCIAVTIFNQRLRIGAICHAILPKNPKGRDALRYVDSAISFMLQKLDAMGIGKNEMEVKLLGGADVLERNGTAQSVGQKNIETALEIITQENLSLAGSDVGGRMGRKLHFYTYTGRLLFTRIKRIPHEQD
jgi:chemotaxis protein CheD